MAPLLWGIVDMDPPPHPTSEEMLRLVEGEASPWVDDFDDRLQALTPAVWSGTIPPSLPLRQLVAAVLCDYSTFTLGDRGVEEHRQGNVLLFIDGRCLFKRYEGHTQGDTRTRGGRWKMSSTGVLTAKFDFVNTPDPAAWAVFTAHTDWTVRPGEVQFKYLIGLNHNSEALSCKLAIISLPLTCVPALEAQADGR
eukprot:TRINITY_DN38065_c0_g1_i1.p1 TRINITY_DN38065_c0_g1~~TRINITY_DN38065_c0_g1_i1.p1  ORF type:complete len:195 (-),score=47.90 TRINITY_DN38065_c0_g1_i1:235-819(-)